MLNAFSGMLLCVLMYSYAIVGIELVGSLLSYIFILIKKVFDFFSSLVHMLNVVGVNGLKTNHKRDSVTSLLASQPFFR